MKDDFDCFPSFALLTCSSDEHMYKYCLSQMTGVWELWTWMQFPGTKIFVSSAVSDVSCKAFEV